MKPLFPIAGALLIGGAVYAQTFQGNGPMCAAGQYPADLGEKRLTCISERMPYANSHAIKLEMMAHQHPGEPLSAYELDHIIPLCLGGSNDRSNLQIQPIDEARAKDDLEAQACHEVKTGRVPLATALTWFHGDWRGPYCRIIGAKPICP